MSQYSDLANKVAQLTQRLNDIVLSARKIFELPFQSILKPGSKLQVSNPENISEFITVQQILDAALSYRQNQLLSIGTITVAGNDLTVPAGATWVINNIDYSNPANIVINVPYAEDGFTRTDIIVADQLNNMYRVNGPETEGVSPTPNVPLNTVLVTTVNVTDDSIGYVPPVTLPYTTDDILNVTPIPGETDSEALVYLNDKIGIDATAIAYVESNGNNTNAQIGNSRKAFLTIDAALDALPSTGGIIKIGIGSFLSPTPIKIKSNTAFIGEGKPVTNSIYTFTAIGIKPTVTSPTKLVGGTILLGTFDGSLKDGIQLHNLGVDSGLDYCNTYKAGVAQEALVFAQFYNLSGGLPSEDGIHQLQSNSPPRTGIVVNNVSALCKSAASLVHAMQIENTINAKISNVSTYFGVHGLVIKSIGANVNGVDAHGHGENGIIVKANDYAYGEGNNISNFYVTSIATNDGGGVKFASENNTTSIYTNLSNGVIEYTKFGINGYGLIQGTNIDNVLINMTQGIGLEVHTSWLFSNFSNIETRSGTLGFKIYQDYSANSTDVNFSNCRTYLNSGYGFDMSALNISNINLKNCISDNVSGSRIVGNVIGDFKERGAGGQTGSLVYSNSTSTDFISSIDSRGVLRKSGVRVTDVGTIAVNTLTPYTNTLLTLKEDANLSSAISIINRNGTQNWTFGVDALAVDDGGFAFTDRTAGVMRLMLSKTGGLTLPAMSGTVTRIVVADASGNLSATDIAPISGTYTPVLTSISNLSTVTGTGRYTRIGNTITVYVRINLTESAGNTDTSFRVSLPINRTNSTAISSIGNGSISDVGTSGNKNGIVSFDTLNNSTAVVLYRASSAFGGVSASLSFQYTTTE